MHVTLSALDSEGYFISPSDRTPQEYIERAYAMRHRLLSMPPTSMPATESAFPFLESLFATTCRHIPLKASKRGLLPWEPACCWIEEVEYDEGATRKRLIIPSIQIHPSLCSPRSSLWGSAVSFPAVFSHEIIHALRAPLQSQRYEEHIAYRMSLSFSGSLLSRFRCFFGPLFSSPGETLVWCALFIITLGALLLLPIFTAYEPSALISIGAPFLVFIPCVARLFMRHKAISQAIELLHTLTGVKGDAIDSTVWPILVRLSDDDIDWLSSLYEKRDIGHAKSALKEKGATDWRWAFLYERFFYKLCQGKQDSPCRGGAANEKLTDEE